MSFPSACLQAEHVSGAGVAEFLLVTQTYFCDSRTPLHSLLHDLLLPIRSRSSQFFSHLLAALLPLTRFLARSALVLLQCFKQQTEKVDQFFIQRNV